MDDRKAMSLYVHVPFCAKKCHYCAFYSAPSNSGAIQAFVDSLELDWRRLGPERRFRTVFFGGGTPSLLNLHQWSQLFAAWKDLGWHLPMEWTVECNPATVSYDKARLWLDHGVNRVSMGVQSFDETTLARLGRVHSRETALRSYETLRQAGVRNINLDLMFAIPGQSFETWESTLREAAALEPEHLACYEVIYEEDTPLYAQLRAREFDVDLDLACDMYDALLDHTRSRGFTQYEVANFARGGPEPESRLPAFACKHNVTYWKGGEYLGLGPSAASYLNGVRFTNVAHTEEYCRRVQRDECCHDTTDALTPEARAGEVAAFGLRMPLGWGFEEFLAVTGRDLRVEWRHEMEMLVRRGWGERVLDGFRLSREGLRFADAAGSEFLRI